MCVRWPPSWTDRGNQTHLVGSAIDLADIFDMKTLQDRFHCHENEEGKRNVLDTKDG